MKTVNKKNKHLTYEDRNIILEAILNGSTKSEIARILGKDKSTIGKEIQKHRHLVYKTNLLWECSAYKTCSYGRECHNTCPDYVPFTCYYRDTSPGVCNGCSNYSRCRFNKFRYSPKRAYQTYRDTLVNSRKGLDLDQETIERLATILVAPLKKGQSPYMVIQNHPEAGICVATLYNYIQADVFKPYGLTLTDLRQQVKRKRRKRKNDICFKKRDTIKHIEGRRYEDYLQFVAENPALQVCQMDTVYNTPGGPYLQTFKFVKLNFIIAFLHARKTAENMVNGVHYLEKMLGKEVFTLLCSILLTDRGSEFQATSALETSQDGTKRCHVFYCDPMQAGQKGSLENRHTELRYVLPKGKSFQELRLNSQKDLNLVLSHLNSYPCKANFGKNPFELAEALCPTLQEKLNAFGISQIPKDDVLLKPELLKQ